jgi:hypothetical protein
MPISCYADDLKLFKEIRSVRDAHLLQSDLDALERWSGENRLSLNIEKFSSITISRKKHQIETTYKIGDERLKKNR